MPLEPWMMRFFAERIFEILKAAPAVLGKDQMYELEEKIQGDQTRRAAFALASMSGADLLNAIESDRSFAVTASGIADEMENLQGRYRQLVDLFEGISGRITVALASREDMLQIREEGKAVFA